MKYTYQTDGPRGPPAFYWRKNMKHILSCSFGKDSIATALLALQHGEPLDELVYCEVMFSEEISGELPEHNRFIHETAIPYFEQRGIPTRVLRSEKTYLSCFYHVVTRGKTKGMLSGFPLSGRCTIQRDCKLPPIKAYQKALPPDTVQYIGIAADEPKRLARLKPGQISLLDKYHVAEPEARSMCAAEELLSPLYDFTKRGGCWFCPNASISELRHLYRYHPELWQLYFLRFVAAKALVGYGMDIMLNVFSICNGIVTDMADSMGGISEAMVSLPAEMQTAIENVGFLASIPLWLVTILGSLFITVLSFVMILTVYGRFFRLYMYTALAPLPLAAFAGESTQSVGISFLKSYVGVCLEGAVIVLACVIYSAFVSTPTVANGEATTIVWSYLAETVFNMLVLVGLIKGSDRIIHEMMGL